MLRVIAPSSASFEPPETSPTSPLSGRAWRQSVGLQDVQFVLANNSSTLGPSIENKFKPINDLDIPLSPSATGKEKAKGEDQNAEAVCTFYKYV